MMQENYFDLLAFLVSSAVNCVKEPKIYGPLRLIETTERLIRRLSEDGVLTNPELLKIAEKIESQKLLCMTDEEGFYRMLREVSVDLTEVYVGGSVSG